MQNRQSSRLKPATAPSPPSETLRQMRESLGWTQRRAADELNRFDPSLSLSHAQVDYCETDGTFNIKVIRAMSHVYDRTMWQIEAAATAGKKMKKKNDTPALSP